MTTQLHEPGLPSLANFACWRQVDNGDSTRELCVASYSSGNADAARFLLLHDAAALASVPVTSLREAALQYSDRFPGRHGAFVENRPVALQRMKQVQALSRQASSAMMLQVGLIYNVLKARGLPKDHCVMGCLRRLSKAQPSSPSLLAFKPSGPSGKGGPTDGQAAAARTTSLQRYHASYQPAAAAGFSRQEEDQLASICQPPCQGPPQSSWQQQQHLQQLEVITNNNAPPAPQARQPMR